jgi:hypothetical protein
VKITAAVEYVQNLLPPPALQIINWGAAFAGLGWFFTTVVPAIVGVLSGIWLGCQIWLFFKTKPWRKR